MNQREGKLLLRLNIGSEHYMEEKITKEYIRQTRKFHETKRAELSSKE